MARYFSIYMVEVGQETRRYSCGQEEFTQGNCRGDVGNKASVIYMWRRRFLRGHSERSRHAARGEHGTQA